MKQTHRMTSRLSHLALGRNVQLDVRLESPQQKRFEDGMERGEHAVLLLGSDDLLLPLGVADEAQVEP